MSSNRNRSQHGPENRPREDRRPWENYRASRPRRRQGRPGSDPAGDTPYGVGADAVYTVPRRRPAEAEPPHGHGEPHWDEELDYQQPHPGYDKPVSGQGTEGGFWTQDVDDTPDDRLTGEELRRYLPHDHDYMDWREEQLRNHDRDYDAWRAAQRQAYDEDYGRWRRERADRFHREFTDWRNRRRGGDE